MTDKQAKNILKRWPNRTKELFPVPGAKGHWVRAQPKDGRAVCPFLRHSGAKLLKVQPDAMWVFVSEEGFADAVCVEVCNSTQNLHDKRSRYLPSGHSVLLELPVHWLKEKVDITRGKPRWEAMGTISELTKKRMIFPIRHLRVLYALRDELYEKWAKNYSPAGHEFFCLQSSLGGRKSQKMQRFLKMMSPTSHFLTRPYRD